MNKFFSLVACVATSLSLMAAENIVWTGNEPISWNTEVYEGTQFETPEGIFTGLQQGNVIKVSIVAGIDEPQYVLTYKAGEGWNWTDLSIVLSDTLMSYTVESEQIATEIAERGLIFRGQGYNITQIAVQTEDEPADDPIILVEGDTTTLWENAEGIEMAWNEICEQDTAIGYQLAAKDKILVTVSAKNPATEWPKVILRDAVSEEVTNELLNEVSDYPYIVTFVLTEEFAAAVQQGFRISGDGVTITRVAAYKYKSGDEPQPQPAEEYEDREVWTGDIAISWNQEVYEGTELDTYTVQQDMLAGLAKDDSIKIYYSEAIEGAQFALTYKAGSEWSWTDLVIAEHDGFFAYKVASDEIAQDIADHGLVVRGQGYHATRIVIGTPKSKTAIENVNYNAAFEGIRFNLMGQRVDENYKGIVIINGQKVLQK